MYPKGPSISPMRSSISQKSPYSPAELLKPATLSRRRQHCQAKCQRRLGLTFIKRDYRVRPQQDGCRQMKRVQAAQVRLAHEARHAVMACVRLQQSDACKKVADCRLLQPGVHGEPTKLSLEQQAGSQIITDSSCLIERGRDRIRLGRATQQFHCCGCIDVNRHLSDRSCSRAPSTPSSSRWRRSSWKRPVVLAGLSLSRLRLPGGPSIATGLPWLVTSMVSPA